jgi:hypothetical protein
MKKQQNEELRKFFRAQTVTPLFARLLNGSMPGYGGSRLSAQGFDEFFKRSLVKKINISVEALSFESDIPFAQGDLLELRLMLEDVYEGVIDFRGEVLRVDVRQKNYRIAVKYLGMDNRVQDIIGQFVAQRENQSAKISKKMI